MKAKAGLQMNTGASIAKHKLLYFLHADSILPDDFTSHILNAYANGAKSGCFGLAFDHDLWFLKANARITRFDVNTVRSGDQSLFVNKDAFQKPGGFKEDLSMMEDQEIIHRLKKHGKFNVLKGSSPQIQQDLDLNKDATWHTKRCRRKIARR